MRSIFNIAVSCPRQPSVFGTTLPTFIPAFIAPVSSSLSTLSVRRFASAPSQQLQPVIEDTEYNRFYDQRSNTTTTTTKSRQLPRIIRGDKPTYNNNNRTSNPSFADNGNPFISSSSPFIGRPSLRSGDPIQPRPVLNTSPVPYHASPVSVAPLPSSYSKSAISLNPDDYPIHPMLRKALETKFDIKEFFPIQAECYHPIADGKDLIGRSKTGTGKTLAFVLPILERLKRLNIKPARGEISVLIMEPTRELANQVCQEIQKLNPSLNVVVVYGGVSYQHQQTGLLRGADIVVGTPGRLMDLLDKGSCTLRNTSIVILDEADEMLRRGFRADIDTIMSQVAKQKQTLLFSATLPSFILEVSRNYQTDAVVVDKVEGEENTTPNSIIHEAMAAPQFLVDRLRLIGQLAQSVEGRVICFVNSKRDANRITEYEYRNDLGVTADVLHGEITQMKRDATMAAFKAGKFKLLVATDVAARGLDVPGVDLVIQNGLPNDTSFYVHRTGRTARAGRKGRAVLLYSHNEREEVAALGRDVGVHFKFAAPPSTATTSYSILSGEMGCVTYIMNSSIPSQRTRDYAEGEVCRLLGIDRIRFVRYESYSQGIVFDLSKEDSQQLSKVLSSSSAANISLATELPEELTGRLAHFTSRETRRAPGGRRRGGGGRSKFPSDSSYSSHSRYSTSSSASRRLSSDEAAWKPRNQKARSAQSSSRATW